MEKGRKMFDEEEFENERDGLDWYVDLLIIVTLFIAIVGPIVGFLFPEINNF